MAPREGAGAGSQGRAGQAMTEGEIRAGMGRPPLALRRVLPGHEEWPGRAGRKRFSRSVRE